MQGQGRGQLSRWSSGRAILGELRPRDPRPSAPHGGEKASAPRVQGCSPQQ